jgi:hypothetical protein
LCTLAALCAFNEISITYHKIHDSNNLVCFDC